MVSHLTFPYEWVECVDGETCNRIAHLDASAEELNAYPVDWVKAMFGGNCDIGANHFAWLHEVTGVLHCENGPAVESADGMIDFTFVDGRKIGHVEDFTLSDERMLDHSKMSRFRGSMTGLTHQWFENGYMHRVDGPAVICADGSYMWWGNGERHRAPDGGPCFKRADGSYVWMFKGAPWYDGRLFKLWWRVRHHMKAVSPTVA